MAGAVLGDTAKRLAESIQTCPRPVPANAIINDIRDLHAAVVTASAELGLAVIGALVVSGVVSMAFIVLALGPGPPADHWLSADLHYHKSSLVTALVSAVLGLRAGLSGPAQITAACDDVAVQLNALRGTADGLAAEPVLAQVEALECYVDKIGLGFELLHFRISYAFVCVARLCHSPALLTGALARLELSPVGCSIPAAHNVTTTALTKSPCCGNCTGTTRCSRSSASGRSPCRCSF